MPPGVCFGTLLQDVPDYDHGSHHQYLGRRYLTVLLPRLEFGPNKRRKSCDTPPEGAPKPFDPERWPQIRARLEHLAREVGLPIDPPRRNVNSRFALETAELVRAEKGSQRRDRLVRATLFSCGRRVHRRSPRGRRDGRPRDGMAVSARDRRDDAGGRSRPSTSGLRGARVVANSRKAIRIGRRIAAL